MKRTILFSYSLFCILPFLYAQQETSLHVKGVQGKVEVLRDKWGMNHIYASNTHDLFFAQGYCAAKDRLFQFEIWRRQATGTVAEILGPRELKRDIGTRLFRFRGDMKTELRHYHPDGIKIINAYVAGVNAYIEEALQGVSKLPPEFAALGILPGKWTADVVISRHQGLLGNISQELNIGRAVARAGEAKVKDLMWFHPKEPDLRLDPSITTAMLSKDILDLYDAYRGPLQFAKEDLSTKPPAPSESDPQPEGSNNWIVSGKRTASGAPILANDPHRAIAMPSLRYMVHLVAPGWNVTGGGEPVIPGVSIGHNEYGAWGLTIYETDGEDLYVYDLNPANLNQYRHGGKWVAMRTIREEIRVKGQGNVSAELRYTVHGPVTFIDSAHRKAYAVKCAWLEPGGSPYLASLRINVAKNWTQFRDASAYSHIPGENMIWADKEGNIGWQVVGITPIRTNFSGMVPVPGDGRYEWKGYLDIKKRPHLLNPAKGFFATANQDVTPPAYAFPNNVGYTWADPFRGTRINEVLTAQQKVTVAQTRALQTDYFSIPARTFIPFLRSLTLPDPVAESARKHLEGWNFHLDKGSVAAGVYAMWERALLREANERFVPKELRGLVRIQLSKLVQWMQNPDSRFGINPQRGRDAFVIQTFDSAVKELRSRFGVEPAGWVYGQTGYKRTQIAHPLFSLLPDAVKGDFSVGPLPRGGNSHTPNSTGPSDNQVSGASFRMIADLSHWDSTLMINTPGQSGDPRSPYAKNLFPLWAADDYFPAYFSRSAVVQAAGERLVIYPRR